MGISIGLPRTQNDVCNIFPSGNCFVCIIRPWEERATLLCLSAFFCIIVSMYGGGFATIPAYLADMFGTQMVGAIHGRLLTAWSTAGVLGPVLVNYIREYQLSKGVEKAHAYDLTMYILAFLLVVGFICNLLVRPVHAKHHMTEEEHKQMQLQAHKSTMGKNEWFGILYRRCESSHQGFPCMAGGWHSARLRILRYDSKSDWIVPVRRHSIIRTE